MSKQKDLVMKIVEYQYEGLVSRILHAAANHKCFYSFYYHDILDVFMSMSDEYTQLIANEGNEEDEMDLINLVTCIILNSNNYKELALLVSEESKELV